MRKEEIKKTVRQGYAQVAKGGGSCCGPQTTGCCGTNTARDISKGIGYSEADMSSVPDGANLGLGCGNPVALATLKEGEVVLDLGSGAGFDCFLASSRVGAAGKVIGVDMTPEMVEKARENARKGGFNNVEFRLGEIENLPVADRSVDIIISNCVINLSPDKQQVFSEAYRVLKPGGRLMVSDIVLLEPLPESVQKSVSAYIGCLAGAALKETYLASIAKSGFQNIELIDETGFGAEYISNDPTGKAMLSADNISEVDLKKVGRAVRSIKVSANRPA
ncbi:MAG: arsenite methyltransferase [Dehalococcoidia bacterium]|jgi:ubiquinone/menaquinone biosynthesis C-methylase UbiE